MASNPRPHWNVLRTATHTEYELYPSGNVVFGMYNDSWDGTAYVGTGLMTKHFYLHLITD